MKRAIRRHHYQRLKKKAKRYYFAKYSWWRKLYGENREEDCGFIADTQTPCSEVCCGNPRKHFNKTTKQERLHSLEFELGAE